jgi:hypothetical protein
LGKKSFLHIGTGVDIQPKKRSRKITGMLAENHKIKKSFFPFQLFVVHVEKVRILFLSETLLSLSAT